MNRNLRLVALAGLAGLLLVVASCGGGHGGSTMTGSGGLPSMSSGTITAVGSVFVTGHEFGTGGARVIDDDSGATLVGPGNLEVGMVVTVHPAAGGTAAAPEAADIHVSPLARGFVDASDGTAGTITVMGQTVQITSATAFSDRRACVTAMSGPCQAVAGQGDLAVSSGVTPGSFVAVHGYLYSTGATAQIVATLVSVQDYAAGSSLFKVEGQVTAVAGTTLAIGGESVDLSHALCRSGGVAAQCSAFAVNEFVAAVGTTAPVSGTFAADRARSSRLLPQTTGATVEVEGKVSSVMGAGFVVRGIQVDGSGLPAGQMPAVGDLVEVLGTVAADGLSIVATSVEHDVPAAAARLVLAGPLDGVNAGSMAGTFTISLLGQSATVDSRTEIADRTMMPPPTFNIGNFDTYLTAKGGVYVLVRCIVDSGGNLRVTHFDIVAPPPGQLVGIAGAADAPAVIGMTTGSVAVHGVPITYVPALTLPQANATVAQGSFLIAVGTMSSATIDTTAGFLFVLPASMNDHGLPRRRF